MNSILIKNIIVKIPSSEWYSKKVDIIIKNKIIEKIDAEITDTIDSIIDAKNSELFLPLIDIYACSGEPNLAARESLDSLEKSAIAGGFSSVFHFPSPDNPLDTKSSIAYLKNQSTEKNITIHQIGSMHHSTNPDLMTEMQEMKKSGAIGFTNLQGKKLTTDFLNRTIQYAKSAGLRLIFQPENIHLSKGGQVNQGSQSLRMGYKGIPNAAEYLALQEILEICKYNNYNPIIYGISCIESLEVIQKYMEYIDIQVGCSISNLFFNHSKVYDYDTSFKLYPPLRSEENQNLLINAVKNNSIQFIYSQHNPWTPEEKMIEFDRAEFGTSSIEATLGASLELFDKEYREKVIDCFSTNIYTHFGLNFPKFKTGVESNFSVVSNQKWSYDSKTTKSKSKCSAYYNCSFSNKICLLSELENIEK